MRNRQSLNQEQIIAKAIRLADEKGINELSMRKLAAELNIQAMSLYYHFKTKDELLSLMADKLVTQIEFGDKDSESVSDWRSIMLTRACSAKALFVQHPWLPFVLDSQIHSGIRRLEYLNRFVGILRKTGFPIELALKVASVIDGYIYGFCRQQTHVSDPKKTPEELADDFSANLESSDFPFLNEATSFVMEKGYDADAYFLFGLNVILNGISLELDRLGDQQEPV